MGRTRFEGRESKCEARELSNFINLSDEPNHLRETAIEELETLVAYHDDPASHTQARMLLRMEFDRYLAEGAENFQISQLVTTLLTAQQNKLGQRTICGLVTVVMLLLRAFGQPMTLERASSVVSEIAGSMDKMDFSLLKGKVWERRKIAVVADKQTIKRYFRRYRPVCHILAAQVIAADYWELRQPFEVIRADDARFLATVAINQSMLRDVEGYEGWGVWEIRYSPPYNLADFPAFSPHEGFVSYVGESLKLLGLLVDDGGETEVPPG